MLALFAELGWETANAYHVEFAQRLNQEEQHAIAENLTGEQLAVFDILTRPDLSLIE